MAGKLTFAIAINLLTDNLRRGGSVAKSTLQSIQVQILTLAAALGAGSLGFSNLISQFVKIARESNRVTTALKNISGSISIFADNQRYLLDLSQKYGLEINALTGNYAKFKAAADASGMSVNEQRKIFESVSRAVVAFGMNVDDSNGVFLALSQMMSKGKISSEELRLQMGERLPIALQAMAKAAGTSVGGLDKLLRKGKLLSADILPKFAEALNEMIPNIDTDNLETSVNRLKNTFTEIVNQADIQGKYKKIVDTATIALKSLSGNLQNVMLVIVASIAFIVTQAASKIVKGWKSAYDKIIYEADRVEQHAARATEKRVAAESALLAKKKAEQLAAANYEKALASGTANEVISTEVAKLKAVKSRVAAESALEKSKASELTALERARSISGQTEALKSARGWTKAFNITKAGISKVWLSLVGLAKAFAPGLIISGIAAIVMYLKNMRDEAERVSKIFSDYKNDLGKVTHTSEIAQLKVLQGLYNNAIEGSKIKEQYQKRIEGLLGREIEKNENLNDIIRERITLLETSARSEYAATQKIKAEEDLKELYKKYGGEKAFNHQYNLAVNEMSESVINIGTPDIIIDFDKAVGFRNIIKDASNILKESETYLAQHQKTTTVVTGGGEGEGKKKKTPLEKAQEKYSQELGELNAKLEIGKLRQQEYNKALDELNVKMYAEAKGSGDKQLLESKYLKNLEEAVKHPTYNKSQDEFEILQKNYNKSLKELNNKLKVKVISEKDYRESLVELNKSTMEAAGSIEGISEEGKNFITGLKWVNKTLKEKVKLPDYEKRDTFYDYKKTKPEIVEADKSHAENYRDKIKSTIGSQADELEADLKKAEMTLEQIKVKYKEIAPELISSLNDAMNNVTSLDEALKIAQVKEDVKELGKQLRKNLYSGFKDIASSADRLVSSIESIKEVMNDEDASGWEKFMTTLNGIIQMVDSIMSVVNAIQSVVEVSKELKKAKGAGGSAGGEAAKAGTEVLGKVAVTAAQVIADGKAAASAMARAEAIAAANEKEKMSEMELMAAKIAVANASKGFVGIGLAAAQIAAFTVLIKGASAAASIPAFATGGIVPGNSRTGDNVIARVNSGEMILNQGQQSKLFQMINNGISSQGVTKMDIGVGKIKGSDLYLILKNYEKQTGKSL